MTPKQSRFVEEFLLDLNATQAAIRAGYSDKTAHEIGSQLLKNAEITDAIDAAKLERSEVTGIKADRVLAEIATMAFYDPADLMVDDEALPDDDPAVVIDGRVVHGLRSPADIRRLPEKVRRAIVGWSYDKNQNFTVKLADKSKALDQLARHLSLYNDKLELRSLDGLADRMERLARANERDGHYGPVPLVASTPPVAADPAGPALNPVELLAPDAERVPGPIVAEPEPTPKPIYSPVTPLPRATAFSGASWPGPAPETDYDPFDPER